MPSTTPLYIISSIYFGHELNYTDDYLKIYFTFVYYCINTPFAILICMFQKQLSWSDWPCFGETMEVWIRTICFYVIYWHSGTDQWFCPDQNKTIDSGSDTPMAMENSCIKSLGG